MIKSYIAGGVFTIATWIPVPVLKFLSQLDTYFGDNDTLPWVIIQCIIGVITFVIWYIVGLYNVVKKTQR